jgi:hypothetical protein
MAVPTAAVGMLYCRWVRGVARFERWARNVALFLLGLGVLTGLGVLDSDNSTPEKLAILAETALSAQFLVYFLRNGERFVTGGFDQSAQRALIRPYTDVM